VFISSLNLHREQVTSATLTRLLARLRELRERHELTQEAFSEVSGISYKYYQAIEGGRKPDLRLSTLERIAKAYSIEVHELLAPKVPITRTVSPRRRGK
jgi:transcriptional regulator with XRE-family HTH domain